jgi:hypothetical protein
MKKLILQKNKGFVILFAVTISGILLAIALGVANIAYKEVKFGTSGKDTNEAFFAADTGAECALKYDSSVAANNAFTGSATMSCAGNSPTVTLVSASNWSFVVSGLGNTAASCAKVTVSKSGSTTTVDSKGYNVGDSSCASTNPNRVERELRLTY